MLDNFLIKFKFYTINKICFNFFKRQHSYYSLSADSAYTNYHIAIQFSKFFYKNKSKLSWLDKLRDISIPTFDDYEYKAFELSSYQIALPVIISDVEELCGMRSIIYIRKTDEKILNELEQIFCVLLVKRFDKDFMYYDINFFELVNTFFIFIKTKELDIFLNQLVKELNEINFGDFRNFFASLDEFVFFFWDYMMKKHNFMGFRLIISGKLGKALLTRGHTIRICYGTTTSGSLYLKLLFKYVTVSTDSGVFGVSLYIYYR